MERIRTLSRPHGRPRVRSGNINRNNVIYKLGNITYWIVDIHLHMYVISVIEYNYWSFIYEKE